ncbi:hypothetical protein [Catellatospora methionotrophica]|uniref:hypothetical protein n=1 Tax=Catellatospora methionotrophica TaxID=121620 RepID=UPI0033E6E056
MGALAAAALMHSIALAARWAFGAPAPQPFSWRGFALTWLIFAAISTLSGWWDRRRSTVAEPEDQPGAPRALRIFSDAAGVAWAATAVAAYAMAVDSELPLPWAAVATALAFVPMGVAHHLTGRYEPAAATAAPQPSP